MPFKLPRFLLKSISSFLFVFLFLFSGPLFAYPDVERLPEPPSTLTEPPLNILGDQPDAIILTSDGRYVFFAIGNEIKKVDLASWSLASDQIPALSGTANEDADPDEGGNVKGLAGFGSQLFATQDDGDLLIFNFNDLSESPQLYKIGDTELGDVVADTEGFQDEDKLYIADVGNKQIHIWDISESAVEASITLQDSFDAKVTPVDVEFAAVSGGADKIYVSTNDGILFSIVEGSATATRIEPSATTGNDLVALSATPDGDFLLFVDQTDSLIHILDTSTDTSVLITDEAPVDLLNINGSPRDIVVTTVTNGGNNDVFAYVAGPEGLSIIDLDISGGTLVSVSIIDMDPGTSNVDDPLVLNSSSPMRVFSPSSETVLTVNGDSKISVISENPFVTITDDSLGGSPLVEGGTFTLTFEADDSGTYSVRLGGGLDASGTELDSGDVPVANTSVTTASISHSSSFAEGDNEIFVFVTDASGNRGWDMRIINVDTPPPVLVLNSTGFGNEKVYLDFNRLDISDIDHYNLYVATDATTVLSKTDVDGTVSQPSGGSTVDGEVSGLTNGVTYYIAAEGVDAAGNVGPRNGTLDNGIVASAIPQQTIGITGLSGETGCHLARTEHHHGNGMLCILLMLTLLTLLVLRFTIHHSLFTLFMLLLFFAFMPSAEAVEKSPQWFSFEFKVGEYIPTSTITKNSLSKCCNERFELEFGFLYDSKFGVELGVGFLMENRSAVGAVTGAVSRDRFNFMLIPLQANFAFRADFRENQLLVPYVKAGPDFVFFRENVQGNVTKGLKYGLHGTAGLQILLEFMGEGEAMEKMGVNDVYFTIEGEYAWINSFGSNGLNLSGFTVSGGFLFEF